MLAVKVTTWQQMQKNRSIECDAITAIKDPSNLEFLTKIADQEQFIQDLKKEYTSDNYSTEDKALLASAIAKETAECSKWL